MGDFYFFYFHLTLVHLNGMKSGAKSRGLAREKSSFRVARFGLSALRDFNCSGVYRINLIHPCWNVAGR
jgi:hypothetical protein